jgi:hypothetical protein
VVGVLSPRSPWGLRWRRRLRRPPWVGVRFLSRSRLIALVRPFGHSSIRGVLYAPGPFAGLKIVGPVFERVGRLVPGLGAFQVVTIERSEL